jgi:hypothetical protein
MTFKDRHIEFQRIVQELSTLRNHNVSFEADSLDLFFIAEGALVLVALERFIRMILGPHATDADTLPSLLEKATSKRHGLVVLPGTLSREETISRIRKLRNALLHGNYEQAAKDARLSSKEEFFGKVYIGYVETLYKILNRLVAQIDRETGLPRDRSTPAMQAYLASPEFLDLGNPSPEERYVPARLVRQPKAT